LIYEHPEHTFETPIDFVPFRGVASENQTIAWPPEGDFVMNVAGFDEALAPSLPIELEPGLVLAVASLPGLAILKLIAWRDRHSENNKDAADFWIILSSYAQAGNEDRIYEHEIDLLERLDYDLTIAGGALLGRDARRICDGVAAGHIASLLTSRTKTGLLLSQMAAATYEENTPMVERLFVAFREAFLTS
jgi:predicted nucleotidyltransferase